MEKQARSKVMRKLCHRLTPCETIQFGGIIAVLSSCLRKCVSNVAIHQKTRKKKIAFDLQTIVKKCDQSTVKEKVIEFFGTGDAVCRLSSFGHVFWGKFAAAIELRKSHKNCVRTSV